MNREEFLSQIDTLLHETKTAILATVDPHGVPQLRWMTPTLLPHRRGSIFCLTSPQSMKVLAIDHSTWVSWMIQNKALTTIVNLQCRAFLINDPSIRQEVLDAISRYIRVLWHTQQDPSDLLIIESVIVKGYYFLPMEGTKYMIDFEK